MTQTLPVTGNAGEKLVTVGVDTRLDSHVAVALDNLGRRPGEMHIPTTAAGCAKLLRRAEGTGELQRVGIEGAGSVPPLGMTSPYCRRRSQEV